MRQLTDFERKNIEILTAESVEVTLLQPTRTGLEKSILDATFPVRNFLKNKGLHDYSEQQQGPDHRVRMDATLLSPDQEQASRASLYRPKTKKGDPRIWFSGLTAYADADDMIAITDYDGRLYAINITQIDLATSLEERPHGPLASVLREIRDSETSVAQELLDRIRAIARRGLIRSVMPIRADTAIGRTLETELGIAMNASRAPDYKGIELKSYRRTKSSSRENRKTLFAQVPNWKISKFKSSTEILDNFGYQRGEDFKLYCTVNTQRPNSQGLSLRMDAQTDQLEEISSQPNIGAFATWIMDDLRQRLIEKHHETFWIAARSHVEDDIEKFEFLDVLHTKKPIVSQFDLLIEQGEITLDHLIKRSPTGSGKEKGPLFKLNTQALELLFPPPATYNLR